MLQGRNLWRSGNFSSCTSSSQMGSDKRKWWVRLMAQGKYNIGVGSGWVTENHPQVHHLPRADWQDLLTVLNFTTYKSELGHGAWKMQILAQTPITRERDSGLTWAPNLHSRQAPSIWMHVVETWHWEHSPAPSQREQHNLWAVLLFWALWPWVDHLNVSESRF